MSATKREEREMKHYIAINDYRSSTDDGFANTWTVYICTAREQRDLLTKGLPVKDRWYSDGRPYYSTNGIRTVTAIERRQIRREMQFADHYRPEEWGIDN